jgi:hypothetical protein
VRSPLCDVARTPFSKPPLGGFIALHKVHMLYTSVSAKARTTHSCPCPSPQTLSSPALIPPQTDPFCSQVLLLLFTYYYSRRHEGSAVFMGIYKSIVTWCGDSSGGDLPPEQNTMWPVTKGRGPQGYMKHPKDQIHRDNGAVGAGEGPGEEE